MAGRDYREQESTKLYLPMFGPLIRAFERYGYAFLRVSVGAIMIPHGLQKLLHGGADLLATKTLAAWGLPAPFAWAWGLGILEALGGALLVIGLLTRPIALLFVVELLVILFGVAWPNGYPWTRGGIQYPLLLLTLMLAVLARGGGEHSLDRQLAKEF